MIVTITRPIQNHTPWNQESSYLMLELQAANIVAASEESLGAIETTTPKSSPLSASTMTKSPGFMPLGADDDRIKQRWLRLN